MSPLGVRGGSQETRAAVALTLETWRFLGGVLGAAAEPEPMLSVDRAQPSRDRRGRRERGNITTLL